jgi:hypothetical protein
VWRSGAEHLPFSRSRSEDGSRQHFRAGEATRDITILPIDDNASGVTVANDLKFAGGDVARR